MGVGGKGRPATPTALKLVQGTRKDRINTQEPQPAGEVAQPSGMTEDAREIWDSLAPDLIAKKVLTSWDVYEFRICCEAAAFCAKAVKVMAEEEGGEVAATERGQGLSAWFRVWRDSADVLARYGARFGLSPSDRAGLKVGDAPKTNQKDRLLTTS